MKNISSSILKSCGSRILRLNHLLLPIAAVLAMPGIIGIGYAAPSSIPLTSTLSSFPLRSSAVAVFMTTISDPTLLSVNLIRASSTGTSSLVGLMRDDGQNGDVSAGDKIFSLSVQLNGPVSTRISFQASAAFTGVLRRVMSPPVSVTVVGSGGTLDQTGGTIEVTDLTSPIYGARLTMPAGALSGLLTITLSGQRDQSVGENAFVLVSLSPSGTMLNAPALLHLPYEIFANQDPMLVRAAIYGDEILLQRGRSEDSKWENLGPTTYGAGTVSVGVPHFSWISFGWEEPLYTVLHLPGKYLNKGDLIYALALVQNDAYDAFDWLPGHAGLYLGTGDATGTSNDGETIIESIPGVVTLHKGFSTFRESSDHIYMGAHRLRSELTVAQRRQVAAFAIDKENKPYGLIGEGNFRDTRFSCVGLTEAAYDSADRSIIPLLLEAPFILPVQQFARTVPVDSIVLDPSVPLVPIRVRGVLLTAVPFGVDKYTQISTTAFGVRTDLGMSFVGDELVWPSPVPGTYTISFFSNGVYNNRSYTVRQDLTISVRMPSTTSWITTYSNNFESGNVGSEWSGGSVEDMGTFEAGWPARRVLGRLSTQGITFTSVVGSHSRVRVTFDFYALKSWDGNGALGFGPDRFNVSINGTTVLNTTFSNNVASQVQSYPQNYPASNPPYTGAAETAPLNTQGFARYRLVFEQPHTSANLILALSAALTEGISDESWAIDNVLIETQP